jgi:putative Mg2+ transporter-C (MgtC) family protein
MTELFSSPDNISWGEFAARMFAATLFPLLIGLERFLRKKPIDYRPFVIISVGACGLALASMELLSSSGDSQMQVDPSRVFQGVITGIGFLGAGAMFREGSFVQGAGSAAAIWAAGAIGLVCGFGDLWLAATMTAIILILLIVSGPFTEQWDGSTESSPDSDDSRKDAAQAD